MKVLYITHQYFPYFYTGTELLTDNLARYLRYLGVNTEVWAYNPLERRASSKVDKMRYKGIPVTFFSHHKGENKDWEFFTENPDKRSIFGELLKEVNPDVIHVTHASRMGDVIEYASSTGIPYIATLTDYWFLCPTTNLVRKNGELCTGTKSDPNCLKYCYKGNKEKMEKRWGAVNNFFRNASKVVYAANFLKLMFEKNGIDTSNWVKIKHGYNPIGERKRVPDSFYGFAFTGTLQPNKGAHLIIKAFKKIDDKSARLAIYGDASQRAEYSQYCLDLAKNDKRIEFRGSYDQAKLADEFADIDCIIVPSNWFEPFPFTLISAIRFGFEVIGSRIGGIPEIIGENNTESLFKPGDFKDLAKKMTLKLKKGKNKQSGLFYDQTVEAEGFKYFQIYNFLSGKG